MAKKKSKKHENRSKKVFIALPSNLLQDSERPIDEYGAFVSFLRELGYNVKCPLEEADWSPCQPKNPDVIVKQRLKDLEASDHLIVLPTVKDHKFTDVMGDMFYAVAKKIPTTVYLRGLNDLDVPWQLIGLRDNISHISIRFYQSNLSDGLTGMIESISGKKKQTPSQTTSVKDSSCPFGPNYERYWQGRKQLFSRWDKGIETDEVGLCSIKPESIAAEIASQLSGNTVLDAFGGVGGSAIAFARQGKNVICVESSKERIKMARNNAKVYGVEASIEFIQNDVFRCWKKVRNEVDAINLDPPWGGPLYSRMKSFGFRNFEIDGNGDIRELIASASQHRKHVAISLPNNFDTQQLTDLQGKLLNIEERKLLDESRIQLSWHTQQTRVLFMTAFL